MSSRLANLMTQVAHSTETREKLASTYFRSTAPAAPKRADRVARWGVALIITATLTGLCIGWLLRAAQPPAGPSSSAGMDTRAVLTFDEVHAWDLFGRQFGLWWGIPGSAGQRAQLALDENMRVGPSGQSLRFDYAFDAISSRPAPIGVWFALPRDASGPPPAELEFMIRGDAGIGYAQQATLELVNQATTEQHPLTIGADWAAVRVPLTTAAPERAWREFRILLEHQPDVPARGRLYIDQVRLIVRAK